MVGAIGWATSVYWLAATGLIAATALAGAFAVYLIVSERRRHEYAEDELQAQASFLESLVDSMAAVSSPLEANEIIERTCEEAKRLFGAREARFGPRDFVGKGRGVFGRHTNVDSGRLDGAAARRFVEHGEIRR